MRRRGLTILELLVALAILVTGALPVLSLLRGARGVLGDSRQMLELRNRALEALGAATARVTSGMLRDLDEEETEAIRITREGVLTVVQIRRMPGLRAYRMEVRAESDERFFCVVQVVADPLVSLVRDGLPALPDRDELRTWEGGP